MIKQIIQQHLLPSMCVCVCMCAHMCVCMHSHDTYRREKGDKSYLGTVVCSRPARDSTARLQHKSKTKTLEKENLKRCLLMPKVLTRHKNTLSLGT